MSVDFDSSKRRWRRLPRRLAAVLESAVGFSRYCFQATTSDITGTSVAPM